MAPLTRGQGVARAWLTERYEMPYPRGVLVDTLETATNWENLEHLHSSVLSSIVQATAETGSRSLVTTHVAHCYPDGASLDVTFMARIAEGEELAQWETIKHKATECIIRNNGALSHHHGIGYEHAPWMPGEVGALGLGALRALKQLFDPANIMNPGKLLPSATPGLHDE